MTSPPTIERVTAYALGYPEPNNAGKTRHITLVRIDASDGTTGWGEAITGAADVSRATRIILEGDLRTRLLGRDPTQVGAIWQELRDVTYWAGNGGIVTFAISAIDMALWDLAGRIAGKPVYELLGGRRQERIRAASSIIFDTGDLDAIGRQFASLHDEGYGVLKGGWGHDLTIAFGRDAERDTAIVRTVREAVGPEAEIIVDVVAGSGWDSAHAIRMAAAFEPYRLFWLEDALTEQDLDGWRELRAGTTTRLCTGEKGWTGEHFGRLIDTGALDVVMLDPGKAEGVTGVHRVIERAAAAGMSWNAHSWSSAINTAASLHLAAASSNVLVLELKPVPSPMQHELVREPFAMVDGWIEIPDRPGLGVEVDERVVARYAID